MNRNALYVVIGGLAVVTAVLGYQYYQEQQKSSVEISVGERGLTIETK
jgi:predicted negative regulator of RcsB-dependent stress response